MGQLRNEFSWSNRRANSFQECKRRYWFESYGHWGGWERGASDRARSIWILKKIKSRQMWVGELVHEAAAQALQVMRTGGRPRAEETLQRLLDDMRAQFRQSREGEIWRRPTNTCRLYEHEYSVEVSDEEWQRLAELARKCLHNFFQCPFVDQLRELPRDRWLEIEEFNQFSLNGVPVWIKMDIAYRNASNKIVILDWKTGKLNPDPDPIQLTCYAMYAMEKWTAPPEEIETIEYNLSANDYSFRPVTSALVESVRGRILESIEGMKKFLAGAPQENIALPESAFAPTQDAERCRRCPFLKVCPDSPLNELKKPGSLF